MTADGWECSREMHTLTRLQTPGWKPDYTGNECVECVGSSEDSGSGDSGDVNVVVDNPVDSDSTQRHDGHDSMCSTDDCVTGPNDNGANTEGRSRSGGVGRDKTDHSSADDDDDSSDDDGQAGSQVGRGSTGIYDVYGEPHNVCIPVDSIPVDSITTARTFIAACDLVCSSQSTSMQCYCEQCIDPSRAPAKDIDACLCKNCEVDIQGCLYNCCELNINVSACQRCCK